MDADPGTPGGGCETGVGSEASGGGEYDDFLKESDLHKIKEIFWRNNITAFASKIGRASCRERV